MFALLLQRAALLIGADYRPRDCTHPMRSWMGYISQDHHWYNSDNVIQSRAPIQPIAMAIATDVICMYILREYYTHNIGLTNTHKWGLLSDFNIQVRCHFIYL